MTFNELFQYITPDCIKEMRKALGENTHTFGQRFPVESNTVSTWEQGIRRPGPPSLKILAMIKLRHKL